MKAMIIATMERGGKQIKSRSTRTRSRRTRAHPRLCTISGCIKQVQQGGLCCKHGAKTRRSSCSTKDCTNFSQRGGLCRKHGAFLLKTCQSAACRRISKNGSFCHYHHALHLESSSESDEKETTTPGEMIATTTTSSIISTTTSEQVSIFDSNSDDNDDFDDDYIDDDYDDFDDGHNDYHDDDDIHKIWESEESHASDSMSHDVMDMMPFHPVSNVKNEIRPLNVNSLEVISMYLVDDDGGIFCGTCCTDSL